MPAGRGQGGAMTQTPATWTVLATLPDRGAAEGLGAALERTDPAPDGVGVFEMEDGSGLWEVGAYFARSPDAAALMILEAAFGAEFVVSELPPTDWVAKVRRELVPVEAGRFYVHGSHDAEAAEAARAAGRETLLIEAAMAFGTGHHGTTLGCLLALDSMLGRGAAPASVLDLGCGTAVLAMAAARTLPRARVLATDIDPVAVEVAAANLAANDLAGRVELRVADGTDDPSIAGGAPWDLILANILKGPLIALAPGIADVLAPGGRLILSGLLREQAAEVAAAYEARGLAVRGREEHGDWTVLVLGTA